MKINNNTDQATQKLNKMHSENCQTSKTELSLENSQQLNSASCFRKMLPFGCLTEPQVRKIGDITDNKRTSKLTKTHSEIREAFKPEEPTTEIC